MMCVHCAAFGRWKIKVVVFRESSYGCARRLFAGFLVAAWIGDWCPRDFDDSTIDEPVCVTEESKGRYKDYWILRKDDDINIVLAHDMYLSSTGRVHKTPHCSNMKSWQRVQVCSKCFKIA